MQTFSSNDHLNPLYDRIAALEKEVGDLKAVRDMVFDIQAIPIIRWELEYHRAVGERRAAEREVKNAALRLEDAESLLRDREKMLSHARNDLQSKADLTLAA